MLLLPTVAGSAAQIAFVVLAMHELGAYVIPLGICLNGAIFAVWSLRRSNSLLTGDG
jgi:hypothetical protein